VVDPIPRALFSLFVSFPLNWLEICHRHWNNQLKVKLTCTHPVNSIVIGTQPESDTIGNQKMKLFGFAWSDGESLSNS